MEDFIVHMEEYIMQKQSESAPNIDIWKFEANYQKQLEELKRELKNSKDQFKIYITNRMHTIAGHNEEWKTAGSSTYFQLYKTGWEKYQVHFELKKRTEYAPVEMEVALHTKELSLKVERNDALKNLEEEVKKYLRNNGYPENFPVDYDDFDASMNRIFDVLAMLVKEFTPKIDKEILASDQEYHRT